MLVIIMGVSGCGKTTLGKLCAKKYGWRFIDADSFHSKANISKMSEGIPLSDHDRLPWLQALHKVVKSWDEKDVSGVLACSALKESYRRMLLHGNMDEESNKPIQVNKKTMIVHLKGDKDVIAKRVSCRNGHFMNEKLLDSQYEALEEPDSTSANVLSLSIENSVDKNAEYICTLLEMFGIGLP